MLLESYFELNKEQRKKFLSKEERKELRKQKRQKKQNQQEGEGEEQSTEEEQNSLQKEMNEQIEQEVKKQKKDKKQKKSKKEETEEQIEEEQVEQEEEKTKKKKSKKDKKRKKEQLNEEEEEQQQVTEEKQEEEQESEEKIVKKVKKDKKNKKEQESTSEGSSEGEQKKQQTAQYGDDVDAEKWRKENEMIISGQGSEEKVFYPFTTFNHTSMPDSVMTITKQFQKPSLIQSQAWPIVLQDRDCIAIAETGSGKTLGFLLPAFTHILKTVKDVKSCKTPKVLIISPTRELATQIAQVCSEAQSSCGIKSVCVYGGVSKNEQKDQLKKGVQVVIGTPGRMKDLIQDGSIKTQDISMVVLDEADRMLDMGFAPDIKFIYSQVHAQRQSVMFSATWPKEVQEIANSFLANPVMIKIGTEEGSANKRVKQTVEVIAPFRRNARLQELLQQYYKNNDKIIIFVLYKAEAPRVEQFLTQNGYKVVGLHGDMNQKARNEAFQQFKDGVVPILVATDVAARGLDIPNVEHVINYSFPLTVSDYVHRIGRTGRAGKNGNSYTFFQESQDKKLAGDLVQLMKEAGQQINPELEKFGPTIHKRPQHALYGDFYKEVDMSKKPTKIKL